ncbi:hypothetical protein [Tropicibacter sp. S64]|uniref:hypothetical protein n=1 Tax=Tropicibacter sp. S64 TaxID=3415122 RepID=UPI003C7D71C9
MAHETPGIRNFFAENQHLPDVPAAAVIAETGLDMTGMQMTLPKTVEELTLYTLEREDVILNRKRRLPRRTIALNKSRRCCGSCRRRGDPSGQLHATLDGRGA